MSILRPIIVICVVAVVLVGAAISGGSSHVVSDAISRDPGDAFHRPQFDGSSGASALLGFSDSESQSFSYTIEVGGDGHAEPLADEDPLFDLMFPSDLPLRLRQDAVVYGYKLSSDNQSGRAGMVWLSASNHDASWAFGDLTSNELEMLNIEPPAGGATLHLSITITRTDSHDDAREIAVIAKRPDESEMLVLLREYEDELGVDADDAYRDYTRKYHERGRERSEVTELGSGAVVERAAVAVLDYDDEANEYRSDEVIHWEFTEEIAFAVGRYAVTGSRTSANVQDPVPNDVNLVALLGVVAGRLRD